MSKKKIAPVDTAQRVKENPELFLLEAMADKHGGVNTMMCQEADGQQSFITSTTLPTDIEYHNSKYNAKDILEAAGVKFGEVVEGDDMFQYVELPEGWKKVPTDHSMWSKLVDGKGRERAMIFYKAAFYDRSAHLTLSLRFNFQQDYDRREKENVAVAVVTDCDKVIQTTEPIPVGDKEPYEVGEEAEKVAKKWLNEKYSDWRNPGAYWD